MRAIEKELLDEIKELRKEVKELKQTPSKTDLHYHYHYPPPNYIWGNYTPQYIPYSPTYIGYTYDTNDFKMYGPNSSVSIEAIV